MHLPRNGGAFFMLKVKIIDGVTKHKLEDELNEFLSTLTSEAVRNIVYDFPNFTVAIEYEMEEAWKNMICADCQHWDDGNSIDSVMGLCHECGGRKRFNCKACERFKDIRG